MHDQIILKKTSLILKKNLNVHHREKSLAVREVDPNNSYAYHQWFFFSRNIG